MDSSQANNLYKALTKSIAFAAGVIIFLWFLFKIAGVVMLLLLAIVLAIVINAPITWLEKKKVKRTWGAIIVLAGILLMLVFLGWLIIPKIISELTSLINNLPAYANQLSQNIASWFDDYPEIREKLLSAENNILQLIPSIPNVLIGGLNYSLSILGTILIFLFTTSMVIYMVMQPRPLLELYLSFFAPSHRDNATRALAKTSVMLIGWLRSNVIGGAISGISITIFLNIMNIPGPWVWGAVGFFASLIPKLGFYIMAIPPILVALTVSPSKALWVAVFFICLDELLGDFVMPKIRSNTMNIHPTSILFLVLAVTSAFGIIGAIMATPLAAFIKAFYEEFYLCQYKQEDEKLEKRIDTIIYRDL
jgi:putative permease